MKPNLWIIALLAVVLSNPAWAQPGPKAAAAKERVATAQIGFLTHKLQLTSAEAQRFWPVYEAYQAELRQVSREPLRELRQVVENEVKWAALSEKEAEELMRKHAQVQNERERIRRTYHSKFLEVLPAKKVLLLYVAEVQFKEAMLDKLRERPGPGGPGGPGGSGGGRPGPRPGRPGPPAAEQIWE
jgi:Spy/CpxP family protein refolding chaperone